MAAGTLAAPGTEYGPCEGECQHTDCAGNRKISAAECVHCGDPIGYGARFYQVDVPYGVEGEAPTGHMKAYAHATCEERSIEPSSQCEHDSANTCRLCRGVSA